MKENVEAAHFKKITFKKIYSLTIMKILLLNVLSMKRL